MPSNNMNHTDRQGKGISGWCDLVCSGQRTNISGNSIPDSTAQSTTEDITGRGAVSSLTRLAVILSPTQFLRKS